MRLAIFTLGILRITRSRALQQIILMTPSINNWSLRQISCWRGAGFKMDYAALILWTNGYCNDLRHFDDAALSRYKSDGGLLL